MYFDTWFPNFLSNATDSKEIPWDAEDGSLYSALELTSFGPWWWLVHPECSHVILLEPRQTCDAKDGTLKLKLQPSWFSHGALHQPPGLDYLWKPGFRMAARITRCCRFIWTVQVTSSNSKYVSQDNAITQPFHQLLFRQTYTGFKYVFQHVFCRLYHGWVQLRWPFPRFSSAGTERDFTHTNSIRRADSTVVPWFTDWRFWTSLVFFLNYTWDDADNWQFQLLNPPTSSCFFYCEIDWDRQEVYVDVYDSNVHKHPGND